jgi:hypothetical protein
VIAIVLAASFAASPGTDPANLLGQAGADYRAGIAARADTAQAHPHFQRAAEGYEAAWNAGVQTPAVARNMAQARYLAGDLGRCIRNYRRGLQTFPHDPGLHAGLAFARDQVAYSHVGDIADAARPRDTDTLFDRLPISFTRLAWAAILIAAVGWVALARSWVSGRGGLGLIGGLLVLAATVAGGWLWWNDSRLRAHWSEPTAVVVAPGADLRTGNSDEYPKRLDGRLPAGVEFQVLGERGGWLHVELAAGAIGWVAKDCTVSVE